MSKSPLIIIADTSVLINFLNIDRIDLIANHSHDFFITNHVREEVTERYPTQQLRLNQALEKRILRECSLESMEEITQFAALMENGRIGAGESSAIACAIHRKYKLALDDKRAINEARKISPDLSILKTQDLIISMMAEQLLGVEEADDIKNIWEKQYRFHLKDVVSFKKNEAIET